MAGIDESKSVKYYNSLPGIRYGGSVLLFNTLGELLLVKPNYRNTWNWPGGGGDPGEAPLVTAQREFREEMGKDAPPLHPAFVNYIPPREDGSKDVLHFVFTADPVENSFLDDIQVQRSEIDDFGFVPIASLADYVKPYRVTAVNSYLEHRVAGAMLYLQDGVYLG